MHRGEWNSSVMFHLIRAYQSKQQGVVQMKIPQRKIKTMMMDDPARSHRAIIFDYFLAEEAVNRMNPWPTCGPDMNPIEHCWDELCRDAKQR